MDESSLWSKTILPGGLQDWGTGPTGQRLGGLETADVGTDDRRAAALAAAERRQVPQGVSATRAKDGAGGVGIGLCCRWRNRRMLGNGFVLGGGLEACLFVWGEVIELLFFLVLKPLKHIQYYIYKYLRVIVTVKCSMVRTWFLCSMAWGILLCTFNFFQDHQQMGTGLRLAS